MKEIEQSLINWWEHVKCKIYKLWESQKDKRVKGRESILKNKMPRHSIIEEVHEYTNQASSMNSK